MRGHAWHSHWHTEAAHLWLTLFHMWLWRSHCLLRCQFIFIQHPYFWGKFSNVFFVVRLYIWSHTFVTILVPPAFHCYNDDPFVDSTMRISPTTDAMDVMHGYIVESTNATIDTIQCPSYNWPVARLLSIYVRNLQSVWGGGGWKDDQPRGGWRTRPMLKDCQIGNANKHVFIASQVLQDSTCFFLKIISLEKMQTAISWVLQNCFHFLNSRGSNEDVWQWHIMCQNEWIYTALHAGRFLTDKSWTGEPWSMHPPSSGLNKIFAGVT